MKRVLISVALGGWPPVSAIFPNPDEGATGPSQLTGDDETMAGAHREGKKIPIDVSSQYMNGKRIRYQQTGEFHFLTWSCYRLRGYLSSPPAMELFEDALERVRRRYLFVVAGYVVMPEHVHLLVNEPRRALLSGAIQALKLSVSRRNPERPFWQAHYYDFNVSSHHKFVEKLRYIHRNPVRRGLAAKPEDWKWSSFLHYQTGMRGTVEIESEWTAGERGWQMPDWMRARGPSFRISPVPIDREEGRSPRPQSVIAQ